jgi:hypothetical protein|eukprot:COSAG06_NODE_1226_length_10187_cov_23.370936_4_plen_64_part_00
MDVAASDGPCLDKSETPRKVLNSPPAAMSGHIHEPAYYQGAGGYDLHLANMPFAWRDRSFPVK